MENRMQGDNREPAPGPGASQSEGGPSPSEDDMAEGDLGDGMGNRPDSTIRKKLQSRSSSRGHAEELLPRTGLLKRGSEGGEAAFIWTSCSGLYTVFRQEQEVEQTSPRWRVRGTESLSDLSTEELRERLQEVTGEAELLRCELEVTSRHLEGKHEALKILQGQAILDRATSHTKILLQKSEERTKALEKEVNGLQWEITYNQLHFKNFEQSWEQKYVRVCSEKKALSDSLGDRLAVLGACQCPNVRQACPCARSAAASRKQVLQLRQEGEASRGRRCSDRHWGESHSHGLERERSGEVGAWETSLCRKDARSVPRGEVPSSSCELSPDSASRRFGPSGRIGLASLVLRTTKVLQERRAGGRGGGVSGWSGDRAAREEGKLLSGKAASAQRRVSRSASSTVRSSLSSSRIVKKK
ncbi:unnamed protein product, partial [Coregonus sp. 'balchen']